MIAVSLGDPAGIGPELCVRLAAARPGRARFFGDRRVLERAARAIGQALPAMDLVQVTALEADEVPFGQPSDAAGAAQVAWLEAAVAATVRGETHGVCTAPISKQTAARAGFRHPGQTELVAERAGVSDFAMMLAGPSLRVVLATTHLSLAEAARHLGSDEGRRTVARVVTLTVRSLARDFGLSSSRVAVAGLNPHAGEGGMFGREEIDVIVPAMADARAAIAREGLQATITGPHVPDVVFRQAAKERGFDAVVAMTHDQGLIPLKLLDFDLGVNLTLGLPFPRTSPDHGVAYDLAGSGRARADSLIAAFDLAEEITARRLRRN